MRQDFLIFDFLTQETLFGLLNCEASRKQIQPSSAGGLPDEKTPTSDENILLSLKKTPTLNTLATTHSHIETPCDRQQPLATT